MDNHDMNTFLALVLTQNVSRAAEQLNLAQSTVSKRLKQLEYEIGTDLFERSPGNKAFRLTQAGEAFIAVAERWLSVWGEIQSLKSTTPKLTLSIGTLDSMNYAIFPHLFHALINHRPKINLKVVTSHSNELYNLLERREVDVAFSFLSREQANINVGLFCAEPMVGLCLATSRYAGMKAVHPHDLDATNELFVFWGPQFSLWHDRWWDPFSPDRVRLDTAQLLFSCFCTPRQWAIVPISVAWKAVKSGHYRMFTFLESPPERMCYQITHKYPRINNSETMKIVDFYFSQLKLPGSTQLNRKALTLPLPGPAL